MTAVLLMNSQPAPPNRAGGELLIIDDCPGADDTLFIKADEKIKRTPHAPAGNSRISQPCHCSMFPLRTLPSSPKESRFIFMGVDLSQIFVTASLVVSPAL